MSKDMTEKKQAGEETELAAVPAGQVVDVEEETAVPLQKKSKKKLVVIIIVIAVALLVLLGVFGSRGAGASKGNYSAEGAAYRDLTVSVSGTGTIQPIHSSTIVGMVTGDILSDSFEIGDQVEKDQVLYTIDAKTAQTSVEQAEIAVQQAQLSYNQAAEAAEDLTVVSTVSGQISSVEVKQGDSIGAGMAVVTVTDNKTMTLKCNFNSVDAKNIYAGQSATVTITATGETVPATVRNVSAYTSVGVGGTLVQAVELSVSNPGGITGGMAATAQVGSYACQSGGAFAYATQTQVLTKASGTVDAVYVSEGATVAPGTKLLHLESSALEDQVKSASLAVENAKLSLRTAQDMLENYNIKAPISGTVTQKDLSAGDNVGQAGTTVMAVVSDLSALTFDMMIDELDISSVQQGQKVEITVDALPGRTFTGYVDKININGVTANGVTNYPVTVMMEDPDPDLLPGMNVSAEIIIEQAAQVLTVPLSAVGRGNTVQVIPASAISEKDGSIDVSQADEREVTLGINDSTYVEITGGLSEGDLVLVEGITADESTVKDTREELLGAAGIGD